MSAQNGTTALIKAQEVRRAYSVLTEPGQVVEVRALEASYQPQARYTETLAGYFDNIEDLVREVSKLHTAIGIYLTLQPVHPDLLHRAKNRLRSQKRDYSTPDKYVLRYRWLFIDSDPDRVSNISTTDAEHALALAHSRSIREALAQEGWPDPLEADSGNGSHLLYRIDLEVAEQTLVKRVLEGLAFRFNTPEVHIDQTVYNPAQICKLYGTLACKGDHTQKRPHRFSHLLKCPADLQIVPRDCLEAIAAPALTETKSSSLPKKHKSKASFDLEAWITEHQIETYGPQSYEGGTRYVLKRCAWDPSHTDKSAVLIQFANGALSASCRHNSCAGKKWEDFRVIFEPDAYQQKASDRSEEKGSDLALQLVSLALENGELFTTPKGERYARVQVKGYWESLLLEGKSFKRWLLHHYVTTYGSIPNTTALESAIEVLEGRAQFGETKEREVCLRLASHEGNLYLDLGNPAHEVVEITAAGWRIILDPPVCFRRAQGTLPLPRPEPGGSLQELRPFLHVGDEEWLLIQAWLLGTFHPRGPYAILALSGEHGSAKSTTTRLLRSLIDPAKAPLRKEPKDDQAFAIMAHNNYVVALDNLSQMSARLSDNMCTLATGAGDAYRKLYSNDEEMLFEDCRPQIFNGIGELATRGDLIDRCLHIELMPFAPEERQDEQTYWQRFEQARPRILGALLDAASLALRNLPQTTIQELPRMADFALWVQAAESAITGVSGAFLEAYRNNRNEGTTGEVTGSPVGEAVLKLIEQVPIWTGTATDLKKKLEEIAGVEAVRKKTWPGDARVLSNALKRLAPSLREQQVHVEIGYKRRSRYITLSATASTLLPQQETEQPSAATLDPQECNAGNAAATREILPSVVVSPASTSQPTEDATLATLDSPHKKVEEEDTDTHSREHPCTTQWEKRYAIAHEAVATNFSAGYWWCDRCALQREWMELGMQMNYPKVGVAVQKRFIIESGHEKWLEFARDAGYAMVQQALIAARQQNKEDNHA